MEEKRIDELLENEMMIDKEEIKNTQKMIVRGMNKKIIYRSLIVVLVVLFTITCVWYGREYYRDQTSFHLSDLEIVVDEYMDREKMDQESVEALNAFVYANAYISLFTPGMIATDTAVQYKARKVTHGVYEIDVQIYDLFEVSAAGASSEDVYSDRINFSGHTIWPEGLENKELFTQSYRGKSHTLGNVQVSKEEAEDMRCEIESLPNTAIVSLDVMLEDGITLDELLDYQRDHTDSRVVYVVTHYGGVSQEEQFSIPSYTFGFSLVQGHTWATLDFDHWEKYPNLILAENWNHTDVNTFWSELPEYTSEQLIEHYLSCMKLLVNNNVAKYYQEDLPVVIEDVEENGVKVLGYRIFASKEDALRLYDDPNVNTIVIKDVKYSKYQK